MVFLCPSARGPRPFFFLASFSILATSSIPSFSAAAIFSFSAALEVRSAWTTSFGRRVPLLITTWPGRFVALEALVIILGDVVQRGEKEKEVRGKGTSMNADVEQLSLNLT
jgi:hypothetical protein